MADFEYGYFERPDYKEQYLLETVGYIKTLWVEQEGISDQIRFVLQVHSEETGGVVEIYEPEFSIYLDRSATVAYAQLQLLRDALQSIGKNEYWLVHIRFTFRDEGHDFGYCYQVRVIHDESNSYPVTPQNYFGYFSISRAWYYHDESL